MPICILGAEEEEGVQICDFQDWRKAKGFVFEKTGSPAELRWFTASLVVYDQGRIYLIKLGSREPIVFPINQIFHVYNSHKLSNIIFWHPFSKRAKWFTGWMVGFISLRSRDRIHLYFVLVWFSFSFISSFHLFSNTHATQ